MTIQELQEQVAELKRRLGWQDGDVGGWAAINASDMPREYGAMLMAGGG